MELEEKLYSTSWMFLVEYIKGVESVLDTLGIQPQNRQKIFFIRGIYPIYLLTSLFLMSYFYFYMEEDFKTIWSTFYFSLFTVKVLLTIVITFTQPAIVVKDDAINEYI